MVDDDDLRARMTRIDPARRPDAASLVDAVTAEQIRERAMQTIDTAPTTSTVRPRWRRPAYVLGAAATVAAVAAAVAVTAGNGSAPKRTTTPTTLALHAPAASRPGMSSCIRFDVSILRDMPVAFAGTVADVGADTVTLDVDHWYKGGTADRVTVASTSTGTPAIIEGVEFVKGTRYLVAATDGTVNACGFSGPVTTELEQAYAEAFAAS